MKEILIAYIEKLTDENLQIDANEDLLNSGILSSLKVMKLISFIEKEFGIVIPPSDMIIENFITVIALCQYLDKAKS